MHIAEEGHAQKNLTTADLNLAPQPQQQQGWHWHNPANCHCRHCHKRFFVGAGLIDNPGDDDNGDNPLPGIYPLFADMAEGQTAS